MNRATLISVGSLLAALAACGDEPSARFKYTAPEGGVLRLVSKVAKDDTITLDFVVGKQELRGYATGFTLPLADAALVQLADFAPGTALDPGSEPAAALAKIPESGPLAGALVVAQSQKLDGPGAVTSNVQLEPGAVLFSVTLRATEGASGVVFDGTDAAFRLPSGGLRDLLGNTVVTASQVQIGKLELKK